jgi:RNA polymerase sigma factor (sigma-70 family)
MPTRRKRPLGDASVPPALLSSAAPVVSTPDACRQLLEDHHGVVVDAVRFVAARNHLTRDVADELRSRVMLHLAQNDYAALRRWRRECRLHTYLVTVVTRVFLDYRNQEWGKAKPPALAKRLGPVALQLWRLTHRHRLSFEEAVAALRARHDVTASREELWTIFQRLPPPRARYFVDAAELEQREHPEGDADVLVRAAERRHVAECVDQALADALRGLPAQDRLILKLFFTDGQSRADIARTLRLDQQRLYPRFVTLLERLRAALSAQGVTVQVVREIVGNPEADPLPGTIESACKTTGQGPSQRKDGDVDPRHRPRSRRF